MEQYPNDYEEQQIGKHKILKDYIREDDTILDLGFAHAPLPFHNKIIVGIDIEEIKKPINYSEIISHNLDDGMPRFNKGVKFDVVVVADVLEHLHNPYKTIKEIYVLLKPEGLLLITIPNVYNPSEIFVNHSGLFKNKMRDTTHFSSFNYNNIYNLLEFNNFEIIKMQGIRFKLPFCKAFYSKNIPLLLSTTTLIIAKRRNENEQQQTRL